MAWFAQTNYPYEKQGINGRYSIAEIGCFVTSFCNLLQRFGKNIDPPSLNRLMIQRGIFIDVDDGIRDDLGWDSVTAYDGQVRVAKVGGNGWPPSNNAIVKFYYKSQRTGKMVTHFCLVADANAGTIIDSWDGIIKRPGIYGTPIAWAVYDNVVPLPVEPRVTPTPPAPAPTPLPKPQDNGGIRYEVLHVPKKMHVVNGRGDKSGANRYSFGNATKWSEFTVVDHKPENFNVEIVAIAHHPVPPSGADYYMDAVALGDYQTNGGRVAWTVGYSWADLQPGFIEPEKPAAPVVAAPPAPEPPAPTPAVVTPPVVTTTAPTEPPKVVVTKPPVIKENPNAWKSSFKTIKPETYIVRNDTMVQDFGRIRPNKVARANTSVVIGGTFIYRDTLYGRPQKSIEAGNWYGIHMTNLIAEAELFSLRQDLATKVGAKQLNPKNEYTLEETLALNLSRLKKSWARFTGNK